MLNIVMDYKAVVKKSKVPHCNVRNNSLWWCKSNGQHKCLFYVCMYVVVYRITSNHPNSQVKQARKIESMLELQISHSWQGERQNDKWAVVMNGHCKCINITFLLFLCWASVGSRARKRNGKPKLNIFWCL